MKYFLSPMKYINNKRMWHTIFSSREVIWQLDKATFFEVVFLNAIEPGDIFMHVGWGNKHRLPISNVAIFRKIIVRQL
jgi:hypothetical protein